MAYGSHGISPMMQQQMLVALLLARLFSWVCLYVQQADSLCLLAADTLQSQAFPARRLCGVCLVLHYMCTVCVPVAARGSRADNQLSGRLCSAYHMDCINAILICLLSTANNTADAATSAAM